MDKGQRFIGCLLAVIAALLAVNVFAKTERSAVAQMGESGPTIIGFQAHQIHSNTGSPFERLFRLWSDGRLEMKVIQFQDRLGCDLFPGGGCNWFDIETCPNDLNNSDAVDFPDLLRVLGSWGPCPE